MVLKVSNNFLKSEIMCLQGSSDMAAGSFLTISRHWNTQERTVQVPTWILSMLALTLWAVSLFSMKAPPLLTLTQRHGTLSFLHLPPPRDTLGLQLVSSVVHVKMRVHVWVHMCVLIGMCAYVHIHAQAHTKVCVPTHIHRKPRGGGWVFCSLTLFYSVVSFHVDDEN